MVILPMVSSQKKKFPKKKILKLSPNNTPAKTLTKKVLKREDTIAVNAYATLNLCCS